MKTRIDFQAAAFNKKPGKWVVRDCTICKYPLSYLFSENHERVAFDRGCDCSSIRGYNINECSWEELSEYYNLQTNEKVIKTMNEFWGFDNE